MNIREEFKSLVNPKKPNGFFICTVAPLVSSYAIYLYFNDWSMLARSVIAPLLIFMYVCDFPLLERARVLYWKAIIPLLGIAGMLYCPFLLYSIIQVYVYFYAMEAIPPIFTAGETLINSHVLTTLFQFALTTDDFHSATIYYPVCSFTSFVVQVPADRLDCAFSRG